MPTIPAIIITTWIFKKKLNAGISPFDDGDGTIAANTKPIKKPKGHEIK